jgi:8-oxo-dGTP pyrophosphatase MutT (NUDIX family)
VRREFSAGGVVVRDGADGLEVAAIRPRGRRPGHWTLPKGHVDDGERTLEAALREVHEETGLRCEPVRRIDTVRYSFNAGGERVFKIVTFWLMRPLGGELGAIDEAMRSEVAETAWLPLGDASRLLAYGGERQVVRHVADELLDESAS